MLFKAVLFVCAQALVMQSISGQCCGNRGGAPISGTWASAAPAFSGGGLQVASSSAPPSGISVQSENAYCGELAICGALPFLGTVGLQGALPTAGSAAVKYGCGNGEVAMLTEDIGAGYAAAAGGWAGASAGRAGCGCGRRF